MDLLLLAARHLPTGDKLEWQYLAALKIQFIDDELFFTRWDDECHATTAACTTDLCCECSFFQCGTNQLFHLWSGYGGG